jgi:SAM-dependent methyltransferase
VAVNDDMGTLLELVACPSCRSSLTGEAVQLRCSGCGHAFPLEQGVPVLEDSDGGTREASRLGRLQYAVLGHPRVYELHQAYGGGRPIAEHVKRQLEGVGAATLLDIGAGTGMVGGLLSPGTRYVWLDTDRLKLRGFLAKGIDGLAVLGDAAQLPFASDAADWTVMVEVSHHLDDGALQNCLEEAARVTRDRFLFVDALRGTRLRSKLLWQLDLGRFPRTEDELIDVLETSFELEKIERFQVNQDHLLCVCVPRGAGRVSSTR